MRYDPEPERQHGTPAKTGVLLVNLGTPEAPTAAAVRRYLAEFLWDPRVVEIPRALWWPILHGVVLRLRPRASARRYASIWTPEGSPLKVHAEKQAGLLRGHLAPRLRSPLAVETAMRYGAPAIGEALRRLKRDGCDRMLVVPLYPQYAASSTASVFDEVAAFVRRARHVPGLRLVRGFHDHPGYIGALAARVREHWQAAGRPDQLVMSFHGLPQRSVERGDPYESECRHTARLLADALGLGEDRWRIAFQSRFGAGEWLKPYTASALAELGRARTRRVDVVCPGFVADCLETLEEIGIEGKQTFLAAGGGEFRLIPALNEHEAWIAALASIVLENLTGWSGPEADARNLKSPGRAQASIVESGGAGTPRAR
ncbi:MAG TPA: ferrochelatase [Burkholderiales bacterium]|nr:ferrochelatase [Burkholderiales bacterium]